MDPRDLLAAGLVALAAAHLVRRAVGLFRARPEGCGGGCADEACSAADSPPRLVELELPAPADRGR